MSSRSGRRSDPPPDRDPVGSGARTHVGYREWASEALGDERQVYARSTSSRAGDLVFLPDGAADDFREAAQSGQLVCPVPGCPSPQLTTRGPETRRHHFVHRQAPPDPDHQRAYVRRIATELIAGWVRAAHPRSTVETDVSIGGLTATAVVSGPAGDRIAVMFVDRRLGVDAWLDADYALESAGLLRGWVFAPRQYLRYPQPSADATPDDPARVDRDRGDVVLDSALFREMRAEGRWPLVLNINRRELANLIVPGGQIARRLGLRQPASRDRVLHLVTASLDKCRLCRDGIATPTVGPAVLAAPRLARDKRAAALDALRESATRRGAEWPAREAERRGREEPRERDAHRRQRPDDLARPESALPGSRVREALAAAGNVTTFATLVTALRLDGESDERRLREELYNLRVEGVIEFDRPLGRFSAIRLPDHTADDLAT